MEKYQIEQWVEANVYAALEKCAKEKHYPTEMLMPLIQMYQTIQLKKVNDNLSNLCGLLTNGNARIEVTTEYSELNIKQS